ncbi:hypothetical protein V6N11_062355 [Hibiscus sabdariffa]|uniref:Uncharacterized protein n=1 Tax=Hibiscus sabdariffa TaxID=183260 RepID=A0ABR2PSV5_9ROSI
MEAQIQVDDGILVLLRKGIFSTIAPAVGWIKINVNWAVSAQGGVAAGGVLKDELEQWIYGFSRSPVSCYVLNAKLWALHDSLDHV